MQKYENIILDDENERYCEIYKITNKINGKCYIGQAVSHVLNHKRYRPYGSIGRFKSHISEAYSGKTKQCTYLNSAIRKYGRENFEVKMIECCSLDMSNQREQYHIKADNTMFPNGYNLTYGGNNTRLTEETKLKVSSGVSLYYHDKRYSKFRNIKAIPDDLEQCIRPLNRNNTQYGWYVYIDSMKTDFGGVHMPLDESKKRAVDFIITLKERLAKHLDAGNSLESSTTTL